MARAIAIVNVETGAVVDVQRYDATAPDRDAERLAAMEVLSARTGLEHPEKLGARVSTVNGHEWFITHDDLEPGMVEVAWGKWGFPKND